MDILRDWGIAALLFAGLVVLISVAERIMQAEGASQWAPQQAPRYADGTPDYEQMGRDYLADEEAEGEQQYCPACLCRAREHGVLMATVGDPRLCEQHRGQLADWCALEPRTTARAIVGMMRYAERVSNR